MSVFVREVVQRVASVAYIRQLIWWIEMPSIPNGFKKTKQNKNRIIAQTLNLVA